MWSFPDIDPVALQIGPVAIRWYALAYLAGILGGLAYIKRLNRVFTPPLLHKKHLDDMMLWAVIGIILGGRLGYVFFYKSDYYLQYPLEIPMIWQGGMAFHGGMIGVAVAFWLFARHYGIHYLRLMDYIAAAAPIGMFFGRLANFINGELFGRVTDHPIGMVFPHGGPELRHPSQLYEAGLEGLVLFVILALVIRKPQWRWKPGVTAGAFLIGYATFRFIVEFFRMPDAHLGLLSFGMSMGQWLCVPMGLAGLGVILYAHRHAKQSTARPD